MKPPVPPTSLGHSPRISFKNILFSTDLGSASAHAQAYAVLLARMFGAHLFVLHVETGPGIANGNGETSPGAPTSPVWDANATAELEQFFKTSGVSYSMLTEHGEVRHAVARVAEEQAIYLIILGSHGRHGISYLFLGSMAEDVTRASTCPVITVGPHAHEGFANSLKTIVYATDFSDESKAALPYAASLAQEFHAELVVLHVAPERERQVRDREHVESYLLNRLRQLAPAEHFPWCTIVHKVAFGETLEEILATAKDRKADLIVVGLHRSVRFTSHLPERLSYRVLCEASCPVMSVLPGADDRKLAKLPAQPLSIERYTN
jgi:nucleotide-binding universal stress UspA family protein